MWDYISPNIVPHDIPNLKPTPGFGTNFLGVKVPNSVPPPHIKLEPLEDPPLVANWHADLAEWGAVLRSVDLARARGLPWNWGQGGIAGF